MPISCCLPLCTKRDKSETMRRERLFLEEKKRILATRRDVGSNFHKQMNPRFLEAFLGGKSQRDFIGAPEHELYRVYLHASEVRLANEHRRRLVHSSQL